MPARIQCPIGASLPTPAKRPPLMVPARALCDHEQLAVRVGPVEATLDAPGKKGAMTRGEQRRWMPEM